ncbi:MAG TPA: AMP-binding protein [Burkholderiales bacterium]|nr:AMP-binding protein [Burkholderiales bacterium]
MKVLLRILLRVVLRVRVLGDLAPFEQSNRILVAAGHRSMLDALLLALFLPRDPMVVVPPEDMRNPWLRRTLSLAAHLVLDVNNPTTAKHALRVLRSGRPLVMFPEGHVHSGYGVGKVYPVPALVALRSGAMIVPVHVEIEQGWLPRARIRVQPPTRIDGGPAASGRRRRAFATRKVGAILQSMALRVHAVKPIFECVLDAIARYGRRYPIIEDQNEEPHSYGELLRGSLAISRWVRRRTAPGENVGLLLPNAFGSVCALLGVCAAGRVPAIFNYSSGPLGVESGATAAAVRTVITARKFVEQAKLEPLLEALGDRTILYLEDVRAEFGLADRLWLAAFALRFPRLAMARRSSLDPAAVLFTSGSEDRPKGVVLSHRAVVTNVAQVAAVFDFSPQDKILNPLPIYHAYSFTAGVVLPLITGVRLYLYVSPLRYRAIPEIAYRRGCTILFGTSTFLSYYARHANAMDFSRMRRVISGGEKLSPEVGRVWMEKFGLRIFEGYGSTEAAPVISLATPANFRRGAVGHFLPGIDHVLEPVDGIDKGGVLHIRGPNLMLGYYRYERPGVIEAPRSSVGEGWYDTGDVVEVDADGIVTISGRIRRFAKIAGEMVSLDMVEHVAREASPEHHHAAILSVQDFGGETTVLFTTDPRLHRAQLAEAARSLGTHDLTVARRIVHLPEMPLLPSGKTDYVGLKALIEGDTFTRLLAAAGANPEQQSAPNQVGAPPTSNR